MLHDSKESSCPRTVFDMYMHDSIKIHKANTDGTERRMGKPTIATGDLPSPPVSN